MDKIVRCKDCVRWVPCDPTHSNFKCPSVGKVVGLYYFCADGEEKVKPTARSPREEIESLKKELVETKAELLGAKACTSMLVEQLKKTIDKLKEELNAKDEIIRKQEEVKYQLREGADRDFIVIEELTKENKKLKADKDSLYKELSETIRILRREKYELKERVGELTTENKELTQWVGNLKERSEHLSQLERNYETVKEENKRLKRDLDKGAEFMAYLKGIADRYSS
jgi:DNA repair exonuclease SbcCD ATPase subunit